MLSSALSDVVSSDTPSALTGVSESSDSEAELSSADASYNEVYIEMEMEKDRVLV